MKPGSLFAFAVVVLVMVVGIFTAAYLSPGPNPGGTTQSSSGPTSSLIQGVVTGFVTVGPSQPSCPSGQSCDVNMSGYSILFEPSCLGTEAPCKVMSAALSQSGHYSILLDPGDYSVTGLSPSCGWLGCSTAFPESVIVQSGVQTVLNFQIDTGIR